MGRLAGQREVQKVKPGPQKLYSKYIFMSTPGTPSVYERIGGEPAVDAAVDIFYRKVLVDDRISRFFDDVDMDRQIAKQKAFLTMAFGGPVAYTGQDMRNGHAHLVRRGLNDSLSMPWWSCSARRLSNSTWPPN